MKIKFTVVDCYVVSSLLYFASAMFCAESGNIANVAILILAILVAWKTLPFFFSKEYKDMYEKNPNIQFSACSEIVWPTDESLGFKLHHRLILLGAWISYFISWSVHLYIRG